MTVAAQTQSRPPDPRFSHLRTSATSHRINQIEQIRANGVGELMDLPQLVVCGDQSAGKSSVLVGITGMPFPRQDGLCTRFPTEIILRHSDALQTMKIVASIRPQVSRSQDDQKTLSSYRKDVQDLSELPSIIEEVSRLMNLRGYTDNDDAKSFASDTLRIEINGPTGLHLSVVDLPGLISVASEEQTDEDIDAIHNMVMAYLQSSRAIILAVVQATNDIANQAIIKLARQCDPDGLRTIGVITKPDLINEGTEAKIALIAKNLDTIKLELGFFLLKNPTPSDLDQGITMEARSRQELSFFSTPVWASQKLDPSRVGADMLRTFLQNLLDAHIERELPKVWHDIKKSLAATEMELKTLGHARVDVGAIRSVVTSLSMRFHRLAQAASDGNYDSVDVEFFANQVVCRLRARVQAANTDFAADMRNCGKQRKAGPITGSATPEIESSVGTAQLIISKAEMMQWVKEAYYRNRGKELPGNYNSALFSELYHEQSRPWLGISRRHVHSVLCIVSDWIEAAVAAVVPEKKLRSEVQNTLKEWLDKAEKLALDELEKLISDERGSPLTYNHYYTDNVQKDRLSCQKATFSEAIAQVTRQDMEGKLHISNTASDIDRFIHAVESRITVDMDEQACKEAMTQLDAYYKVAMKTFVDNVARQVIERHIMGPLPEAFDPNFVSNLCDEELLRIGSEPKEQSKRRATLIHMVDGLRKSLVDLQRPL